MTPSPQRPAHSSPRRVLLRGVVPVVVGVLVGALLALGVTATLAKRWTATSRVLVTATGVDSTAQANSRTTGTINLDTEAQLVTSADVVEGATKAFPPLTKLTFETIVSDVKVSVPPNTSVLAISFTADSAATARSAANALAAAYLDDRQSNAQTLLDRQKSQAQQTVQSLTSGLESLANQLAALPRTATTRGLLQNRIGIAKNQINGENAQVVALGSVQITPGRVVTAASLPTKPSSPSRTINTVSGAGLGLVLGLLTAWLLLRYTRTVRRADDLARVVDLPHLATLDAGAGLGEQYRRLALLAGTSVADPRRLVVAGLGDSPVTSQVATGVAEALVRGGHATALLRVNAPDVNGRRPRGIPVQSRPSTDALAPGEPLAAGLDQARGDRDLLVVAAGGASSTVDAAALGAEADAVMLVVQAGARSRDVRAAVRALDEVGAPMLGVVLTGGAVDAPGPANDEATGRPAAKRATGTAKGSGPARTTRTAKNTTSPSARNGKAAAEPAAGSADEPAEPAAEKESADEPVSDAPRTITLEPPSVVDPVDEQPAAADGPDAPGSGTPNHAAAEDDSADGPTEDATEGGGEATRRTRSRSRNGAAAKTASTRGRTSPQGTARRNA